MRKTKQAAKHNFLGNCPICNTKFKAQEASIIEEVDSMQVVYAECSKCRSSVVLGISKNAPGLVTTVGMLTDMNREDIDKIRDLPPLTSDDVLEMHKYLEKC